jgi:hypothetical protein
LDFRAATPLIRRTLIIIPMGTTCDRITVILSRIRTVTAPGTMAIELISVTIVIITTAIDQL